MKITGITQYMGRGRRTNQESTNQKTLRKPLLTDAQSPLAKSSFLSRIPALQCGYLLSTNNIRKSVQLIKTGTPEKKENAANALGILAFNNTQNQTGTAQADASFFLANLLFDQTAIGDLLRENLDQAKLCNECSKLDRNILLTDQITIDEFLKNGGLKIQRV